MVQIQSVIAEDLGKLLLKVEVIDSADESIKMKPGDIKAFGFILHNKNYSYFSKPTGTDKNLKFLQVLVLGNKGTFYTFEKADATYTYLSTGLLRLQKVKVNKRILRTRNSIILQWIQIH